MPPQQHLPSWPSVQSTFPQQHLQQVIVFPIQPDDVGEQRLHTDHCDTEAREQAENGDSTRATHGDKRPRHTGESGKRHVGASRVKKSRGGYDLIRATRWGASGGASLRSCPCRNPFACNGLRLRDIGGTGMPRLSLILRRLGGRGAIVRHALPPRLRMKKPGRLLPLPGSLRHSIPALTQPRTRKPPAPTPGPRGARYAWRACRPSGPTRGSWRSAPPLRQRSPG